MKLLLALASSLLLFSLPILAHSSSDFHSPYKSSSEDKILTAVEQPAEFPGGINKFYSWVAQQLKYPVKAAENGVQGTVLVQFVVEQDGSVSSPTIRKGAHPDLDREALRIVSRSPKWQPARHHGVPVRSYFYVPISFRLAQSR